MSIRMRKIGDRLIAICAARSVEMSGDIYLDDEQHHALAEKFSEDFGSEGWCSRPYDLVDAAMRAAEESNNTGRDEWDAVFANRS